MSKNASMLETFGSIGLLPEIRVKTNQAEGGRGTACPVTEQSAFWMPRLGASITRPSSYLSLPFRMTAMANQILIAIPHKVA